MSNTITPTVFYRTLNLEGLEIFYREAGPRDAPTVLLLHGFPSSSRNVPQSGSHAYFFSKMKEHRFSLPFTSFGALNFSDETILHKAIFLTWRHV